MVMVDNVWILINIMEGRNFLEQRVTKYQIRTQADFSKVLKKISSVHLSIDIIGWPLRLKSFVKLRIV